MTEVARRPEISPASWLAGRLAVVTGASRGIGAATAGGLPRWAAWRSAADTALSGGRWSGCTTGACIAIASLIAGASKA